MRSVIFIFLFSIPVNANEFEIYARLERSQDKRCLVVVNSGYVSSEKMVGIQCPSINFIHQGKYRLKMKGEIISEKCTLSLAGEPELMPPEFKLPIYSNSEEILSILSCKNLRK